MPLVAPIRETVLDNERFTSIWQKFFLSVQKMEPRIDGLEILSAMAGDSTDTTLPRFLSDSKAAFVNYPPLNYPAGTIFWVSDWNIYYMNTGVIWQYMSGVYQDVLANIPLTLGSQDTGLTFRATDQLHGWVWNGAAWKFADGDSAGYIVAVPTGAVPPVGGLWHVCDGTTQNVAQPNATLVATATPNLAVTGPFLRGSAAALVTNDLTTTAGFGNADSIGLDWYMRL